LWRTVSLVMIAFDALCATPAAHSDEAARYVGGQVCAGCHAAATERSQGSHLALAMQKVSAATVLGDFADVRVEHFGVVTTFSRSGDKFIVRTDGPDGALHDYEIAYTFGVYPLQQYLIAMPGGRLQALGIAWDSRPKEEGGQRWFHLYPDLKLPAGDRLHWTGRDQTWNYMWAPTATRPIWGRATVSPPTPMPPPGPTSTSPARHATGPVPATSPGPTGMAP
jgi:hypothetical protein